jgi:hypothetical protein
MFKRPYILLGIVAGILVYTCEPNTREAETGG